jgi:hypothetical protein
MIILSYPIFAHLFSSAFRTELAPPYFIELFDGTFYKLWVVGEDASFEVAFILALHSYTGAGEIGRADISRFHIEYNDFK